MINYPQMIIVLIAALNPIAAVVLYSNIQKNLNNRAENLLSSAICSLTVFAILSMFLLYGNAILNFFGITQYILGLGGGLLLLILGVFSALANEYLLETRFYLQKLISMFGMAGKPDTSKLDLNIVLENYKQGSYLGLGFCPLAIPVLLNPASIIVSLFINGQINQQPRIILIILILLSLGIFILLLSSSFLTKYVAPIWWLVFKRASGLFLTTIGLEMLVDSVKTIVSLILHI